MAATEFSASSAPSARFDDVPAGRAWVFGAPDEVLVATQADRVRPVLAAVEARTAAGAWAYGFVGYEAAPAFDPRMVVRPSGAGDPPLAWFALGPPPRADSVVAAPLAVSDADADVDADVDAEDSTGWRVDTDAAAYAARVDAVRAQIAAGRVDEVNLTARVDGPDGTRPAELYRRLVHAQRGAHHGFIDTGPGGHTIVCASPELFFRWDADGITTRPMKGTAPRGHDAESDARARADLVTSAKQRTENLLTTRAMAAELAAITEPGTVRTSQVCRAERYPTVWQLTSTLTGRPRAGLTLLDVFDALFPCSSVAGVPKHAAMELIARWETSPRGVYCGAIGMIAPPGAEFRARIAVPIRTATVPRTGRPRYGTGGGITAASDGPAEYREILDKAAVLTTPAPACLLETMRLTRAGGYRNLVAHRARLAAAARYFDLPLDPAELTAALAAAHAAVTDDAPRRARLTIRPDGTVRVQVRPLQALPAPIRLAVDDRPTAVGPYTAHKTTRRGHYEAAAARHPEAGDVVLIAPDGQVIETTRATIAARIAATWVTPPLDSGCLPGVERARLLAAGALVERRLDEADLRGADRIAVISSLRGWRGAVLI